MKVTDLEKFALEQVYRPYWSKLMQSDQRIDRLSEHYGLDDILLHFSADPEWATLVLDRIYRCKFVFPTYIVHPLVRHIAEYSRQRRKTNNNFREHLIAVKPSNKNKGE